MEQLLKFSYVELLNLARQHKVYRRTRLLKTELAQKLFDMNITIPNEIILPKVKNKYNCIHGKYKYNCKECGGSQICEHKKN